MEIGEDDLLILLAEPGPSSPGLDGVECEEDEKSDGGRSFRFSVEGGALSGRLPWSWLVPEKVGLKMLRLLRLCRSDISKVFACNCS